MTKTKEWAESFDIATQDILPPVEDYDEPYKRTAREVAARTIILYAVAAAGHGYDREPIVEWLQGHSLWDQTSPKEQNVFLSPKIFREDRSGAQWVQESQWTLLWTIKKTDSLGLPTKKCNGIRITDEIMPEKGNEELFLSTAELRPVPEIRAEEERIHRLYVHAQQAADQNELPEDLIYSVLFQRHYTFRWLNSEDDWDDVNTDDI